MGFGAMYVFSILGKRRSAIATIPTLPAAVMTGRTGRRLRHAFPQKPGRPYLPPLTCKPKLRISKRPPKSWHSCALKVPIVLPYTLPRATSTSSTFSLNATEQLLIVPPSSPQNAHPNHPRSQGHLGACPRRVSGGQQSSEGGGSSYNVCLNLTMT